MNVDDICSEIIWYSSKREDGTYRIPVCIDFDYTCTSKSSWIDGTFEENPHCFEVLKLWESIGCVFILDTMRGRKNVEPAVKWLTMNGIKLYGLGKNPDQDKDDDSTNKAFGVFSVDDRNVGAFLVRPKDGRAYIDWDNIC